MTEMEEIRQLDYKSTLKFYDALLEAKDSEAARWMGRNDRFFLLGCLMGRTDVLEKPWCWERCREVEKSPDGWLDLWSRFHYKSTIITLAGAVQAVLNDPEITIGVLSYNKSTAERFVDQIRRAMESPTLTKLYPEILWDKPPRLNWSTQKGLVVRRRTNPKEPTIMGSGLVDGQPVGAHFALRIYDDVVVPASVSSPEQIKKTTEAWELSLALGTDDGGRAWYAGTRYHQNDTYSEILRRKVVAERRRLCVDPAGNPTMMARPALEKLMKQMGTYTWSAQMLQDPMSQGVRVFQDEWWQTYSGEMDGKGFNIYCFVDSANAKKKNSDYTVIWTVGYGPDGNYYILDCLRDRMNLRERTDALFSAVQRWRPKATFWEQQGAMSDVAHVEGKMADMKWHFRIVSLNHSLPKDTRIRNLQPLWESGKMWMPNKILRRMADGNWADMVSEFRQAEWQSYPVCTHDDMIDALADIADEAVIRQTSFPGNAPEDGKTGSTQRKARGCEDDF